MSTNTRRRLAVGAGAALLVGGGGAAIGATQLSPRDETKAVVEDAAKQLGVSPQKLSAALEQALENRVEEAVKSGRLTQEQADRLKKRIRAGEHPLLGGPRLHGHGFRGHGHGALRGAKLAAAATYLGTTQVALRASLRAGKTLAQVAQEQGKSVDGLVDALVAEHVKRLDAAVAAGRLTKAQRDEHAARMKERVTARVQGERPAGPGFRGGHGKHGLKGMRRMHGGLHPFGRGGADSQSSYRQDDDLRPSA
ncbi:MAG TPA: hypothetical protein VEY87_12150 [Gaiellaceae bacterium]|nr:hypothetical protein [Gaiellaceae bacterium]